MKTPTNGSKNIHSPRRSSKLPTTFLEYLTYAIEGRERLLKARVLESLKIETREELAFYEKAKEEYLMYLERFGGNDR